MNIIRIISNAGPSGMYISRPNRQKIRTISPLALAADDLLRTNYLIIYKRLIQNIPMPGKNMIELGIAFIKFL